MMSFWSALFGGFGGSGGTGDYSNPRQYCNVRLESNRATIRTEKGLTMIAGKFSNYDVYRDGNGDFLVSLERRDFPLIETYRVKQFSNTCIGRHTV